MTSTDWLKSRICRRNHDRELALGRLESLQKFGRSARDELLMELGQLSTDNNWSINQISQFLEGLLELMRGLEEHHQASLGGLGQLGEPQFAVFRPNWWKSEEREAVR